MPSLFVLFWGFLALLGTVGTYVSSGMDVLIDADIPFLVAMHTYSGHLRLSFIMYSVALANAAIPDPK